MRIFGTTSALVNPARPVPRRLTTSSVILDTIAAALNADGATVEPGDIDTGGMWIVTCNGYRYRLELESDDNAELTDDGYYHRRYADTPDDPDANGAYIGGNDLDGPEIPW